MGNSHDNSKELRATDFKHGGSITSFPWGQMLSALPFLEELDTVENKDMGTAVEAVRPWCGLEGLRARFEGGAFWEGMLSSGRGKGQLRRALDPQPSLLELPCDGGLTTGVKLGVVHSRQHGGATGANAIGSVRGLKETLAVVTRDRTGDPGVGTGRC